MPDDSSGIYNVPAGTLVNTGDTVLPSQHNPWANDSASAISNRFSKDGRAPATGDWNINNFRLTQVGTPSASGDAVNKQYADSQAEKISIKSANYTGLLADKATAFQFTAAATLALNPAATLLNNWWCEVWATNGNVIIDPDSAETINGASTLVLQTGQSAKVFCTGTAFFAWVFSDSRSGPQLQGFQAGLTATINVGTPATHIDVAAGSVASSASPYYLLQLVSSITKNTNTAWTVGSGQGSLDTGAITNSTYYGYVIQRSDTGVVDVLTSLSATTPTMPANYDRRSVAQFTFNRVGGVNGPIGIIGKSGINYAAPVVNPNTAAVTFASIPSGVKRITAHFYSLNPSASALPVIRMGVAGSVASSGYLSNISQSNGGAALVNASEASGLIIATGNITTTNPAFGRATFERLSPSLNLWTYNLYDVFSSSTINGWGAGVIALSGDPDRIQFSTLVGTALLNGTMNISWEF